MSKARQVAACAPYSDEGFDTFFRRMLPRAVGAAERVTGERTAAEDAAVEALTKAHLRWSVLRQEP